LGKDIGAKKEAGEAKQMYEHDVAFGTMLDFNHTTNLPFWKPSHLYQLSEGWSPK